MKKPPPHIHSFILITSLISRLKLFTITFLSFIIIILSAGNVSAQELNNSSKITEYPNGVYKMEPVVFGITEPVRNLPTSVKNAEEKSAAFITKQQREAIRIQMLRDKGIPQDEIQKDEMFSRTRAFSFVETNILG